MKAVYLSAERQGHTVLLGKVCEVRQELYRCLFRLENISGVFVSQKEFGDTVSFFADIECFDLLEIVVSDVGRILLLRNVKKAKEIKLYELMAYHWEHFDDVIISCCDIKDNQMFLTTIPILQDEPMFLKGDIKKIDIFIPEYVSYKKNLLAQFMGAEDWVRVGYEDSKKTKVVSLENFTKDLIINF